MPREMVCTGKTGESGFVVVGWSKHADKAQIGVEREGNGYFTDFTSRGQINGLIRLLRKARDESFGADA